MDWFRQLINNHLLLSKKYSNSIDTDSVSDKENEYINIYDKKENEDNTQNSDKYSNIIIIERSALTAFEIFVRNLYECNKMTDWEFSLLERFYKIIAWEPKHILYLRAEPQTSIKRIKKRNRNGETNVDIDLINNLHKYHELLLMKDTIYHEIYKPKAKSFIKIHSNRIIIIDGNQNENTVLNDAVNKILNIFKSSKQA